MDEETSPGQVRELLDRVRQLEKKVAELEAAVADRDRRIAELEQQLEEARRAGKRQAAPFSRGEPKKDPKWPVGVGFDGTPLINRFPDTLPQPLVRSEGRGVPPGLESPRGPGAVGELARRPDLSGLVGVLLDGFPIYGPLERDGSAPSGLDECGGHVGLTRDLQRPIHHYHVVPAQREICGCLRGIPLPGADRRH